MRLGKLEKKILIALLYFRHSEQKTRVQKYWGSGQDGEGYKLRDVLEWLGIDMEESKYSVIIPRQVYYAIDRLQKKGLLKKFRGYPEDGWSMLLVIDLTEKGEAIAYKLLRQLARTFSEFMQLFLKTSEKIDTGIRREVLLSKIHEGSR